MAELNVVFGTIATVESVPDHDTIVTMTDRQVLRAAPPYTPLLEALRELQFLVYFETEEDRVTRGRIPDIVRVDQVASPEDISFEPSQARAYCRNEAILSTLREAQRTRQWLAVTLADDAEVLDARPSAGPPPPQGIPAPRPGPPPARPECISKQRAQHLFDLVAKRSCDPITVPPSCNPFLFPDNGCWARAHEMARLLIKHGAKPRKIWIYGSLNTPTRNNPTCSVRWSFHVAPTLCVRVFPGLPFWTEEMVIDPSLFTTPVSKATWKSVQGDPNATFVSTSADIYSRFNGGEQLDPTYAATNYVLEFYRRALQARALSVGPPPYAHCP